MWLTLPHLLPLTSLYLFFPGSRPHPSYFLLILHSYALNNSLLETYPYPNCISAHFLPSLLLSFLLFPSFTAISLLQSPFPTSIHLITLFPHVPHLWICYSPPLPLAFHFCFFHFLLVSSTSLASFPTSYNIVYFLLCNPSHLPAFTCSLYPHFRFFDLFIDSFLHSSLLYSFCTSTYIISGIEFKLFDHFKG